MITRIIYDNQAINFVFLVLLIITGNLYQLFIIPDTLFFITEIFNINIKVQISSNLFFLIYQLIVFIVAFQISKISKDFSNQFSFWLPSIIFTILMNTYPIVFVKINDILFLPLILILLVLLFNSYEKDKIYSYVFNYGFFTGIIVLSNIHGIFLFPLLYMWLILFRAFNIKEYLLPIVAFILPFILLDAILFLLNPNIESFFNLTFKSFVFNKPELLLFPVLVIFGFFVFSIYRFLYYRSNLKKIKERKYHFWHITSLTFLWFVYFLTYSNFILFTINVFMSLLLSVLLISFKSNLHSKLFFIVILMLNFVSLIIFI